MGKKSSKTETKPWAAAQQPILNAASSVQSVYNQNQPGNQATADQIRGFLPGLGERAMNPDANVTAAQGYNSNVLGGQYLDQGNPYMEGMIQRTGNDVSDRVNSQFGLAGRSGSGAHEYGLARGLADSENALRYGNYSDERGRMAAAAGQAPSLAAGQFAGVAPYLAAAQGSSSIPFLGSSALAGGVGGLLSPYTTKTSQDSGFNNFLNLAGVGLQAADIFSDPRLKVDVEKVGEFADGLGVYDYRYAWSQDRCRGVMADEVAKLRPWALGTPVGGFATVNYGRL